MVHRFPVGPQRGGDRCPDGARQRTGEVRQARCRRHPLRRQAGKRNGGQRHEEARYGEALNKLWPRGGAKVHSRFKRIRAPVEAHGVHDEAERHQPAHVELMGETANNRRQQNRN